VRHPRRPRLGRTLWRHLAAGLGLALVAPAAPAGEPELVADLFPGEARPAGPTLELSPARVVAGDLYFPGWDAAHGWELWRSDGTAGGTRRVTDVCPGRCDSFPSVLGSFAGEVYFLASDGVSGAELWATDGTAAGQRPVRDLCPGACDGLPQGLAELAGRIYFFATHDGRQSLWASDGSWEGTGEVAPICELDEAGIPCVWDLVRAGDALVFHVRGREIWGSDGSAASARRLAAVTEPFAAVTMPQAVGDVALFWRDTDLWRTDGTPAGTVQVRSAAQLGLGALSRPEALAVWQGVLFTWLADGELVGSDGTPEGTAVVARRPFGERVTGVAALDHTLLFVQRDGAANTLWRSEGTAASTGPVAALPAEWAGGVALGDRALLRLWRPEAVELWATEGTAETTRLLAAVEPGEAYASFVRAGSTAYYADSSATVLRASDGTTAGSRVVGELGRGPAGGGPLEQIGFRAGALLVGRTGEDEAPLHFTDGTANGTWVVSDEASWGQGLAAAGGKVFFAAHRRLEDGYLQPRGLWRTDGSAGGTVPLAPELAGYSSPRTVHRALYFTAARERTPWGFDQELFRSDGSPGGTRLVEDLNRHVRDTGFHHSCMGDSSSPGAGVDVAGRLLFAADDGEHGRELWVSDGTARDTRMVRDLDPARLAGPPAPDCSPRADTGVGSDPGDFVRFAGGALFTADDGRRGRELWHTDGTFAGTRLVRDLLPGPTGSSPRLLTPHRGRVYFVAGLPGGGEGLWRTDGSRRGTWLVHPLTVGGSAARPLAMTAGPGGLFLAVYHAATGAELWASAGSAATTRLVADLRPGRGGSSPGHLTPVAGGVVFAADDGEHGVEPWFSDGSAAGTRLLGDVNPGLDASSPGPFTVLPNGLLLTGANDGLRGREPWVLGP
jgi:ELWxxDGT repeat protein